MPAAIHNFFIEQGSNFTIIFEYLDNNNIYQDLTNYCIRLRLKPDDGGKAIAYSSDANSPSNRYILSKNNVGVIQWSLPYNETQKFKFNTAVYDLDITNKDNNNITRLTTGTIQIIKNNFSDCPEAGGDGCLECKDIKVENSSVGTTSSPSVSPSGNNNNGVTPTPTATSSEIYQEDLCNYLCQDIDMFGKIYNYNEYIKYSPLNSGTILVSSETSIFNTSHPYVIGLLDVYKNNIKLNLNTDYVASNGLSFALSEPASSGDSISYINKGLVIPDNASVTGVMTVADTGIITNIEVSVINLKHNNPQDLSMILVPPSGSGVLLSAHSKINNYSSNSGLSYTFSNKAIPDTYLYNRTLYDNYVNIYDKTSKYDNTLLSSLDSLKNISPSGDWKLIIRDDDPGSSGTLSGWNLVITYSPPEYIE